MRADESFRARCARFVTFGSRRWRRAAARIAHQAEAFDLFDEVIVHTGRDLRRSADFWKQHGAFIRANRLGHGYWLWKPFLILENLKHMETGAILLYADAGCELNVYGRERMKSYLDLCARRGSLFFSLGGKTISAWTKMDTMVRIDPQRRHAQKLLYTANTFFLTKTNATMELVERWYDLCTEDDYRYLDDSRSHRLNHRDFLEHRHDQVIFSLLLRQGGFDCVLDGAEIWFGPHSVEGNSEGIRYPVWTSRNVSGVPTLALLRLERERDPNKYSAPVWAWMFFLRRLFAWQRLAKFVRRLRHMYHGTPKG